MDEAISVAEQSVLGCMMLNYKTVMPKLVHSIKEEYFTDVRHRKIFATALKLYNENKAVDDIVLLDAMSGTDVSVSYISGLGSLMPTASHIDTYIELVRENALKNKLSRELLQAQQLLKTGEKNPYEIIGSFNEVMVGFKQEEYRNVISVNDILLDVYNEVKDGKKRGIMTGYDKFDRITKGLHKQNLVVIASGPGKGKTSFALNIVNNVCKSGHGVLFFTLEMSTNEIASRVLSIVSGIDSNESDHDLMGFLPNVTRDRLTACGTISEYAFYLDDMPVTINELKAKTRIKMVETARSKKTIDLVVVDYLQLVSESGLEGSREREVSAIVYGLKNMAKELNIPVIALAQTNRLAEKEHGRDYKLYDLRESGAIEQAADYIFFLNQDKEVNRLTLKCEKNRHGPQFFMDLEFFPNCTKFIEIKEKQECTNTSEE